MNKLINEAKRDLLFLKKDYVIIKGLDKDKDKIKKGNQNIKIFRKNFATKW